MLKRIFVFVLLNVLIMITISLLLQLFHIGPYLTQNGIDYVSLAAFCLIWGVVGSFVSLLMSRKMAKWMLQVELIDPRRASPDQMMVYSMTRDLAKKSGLPETPEVGIYQSKDLNAFATGPSKRRSLVAVSSGLINSLSKEELEAVIGHEITHIANGDMVTMTLLQGVINAFVMFLARIIAFAISGLGKDQDSRRSSSYTSYMIATFVLEIVFMVLGSIVLATFSRYREYRADAGSAALLGKEPMINALRKLDLKAAPIPNETTPESIAALMIREPKTKNAFIELFKTHPPIEKRIKRLQSLPF